jgi:hypothetical protein
MTSSPFSGRARHRGVPCSRATGPVRRADGGGPADLPRFERGDCPVNGARASSGVNAAGWSCRSRLIVPAVGPPRRGDLSPKELSGAPPLVLLHGGPGGPGGIQTYSAGVAMGPCPGIARS